MGSNEKNYTPLHESVLYNDMDDLVELLSQGNIDVNAETPKKETALHFAMWYGRLEAIEFLVAAGADPNKYTIDGVTPLIMSLMNTENSSAKSIQKLIDVCQELKIYLDLNKSNYFEECPLHFAATNGDIESTEVLLNAGANINQTGIDNQTALSLARENGNKNIAQLLIKRGAKEIQVKPPPPEPGRNLPPFVSNGFHKDERMKEHEQMFGGALWADRLEVFYLGKTPRIGLCVEIAINFKFPLNHREYTWMRGYISGINEDKKRITATVSLNTDHEGKIEELSSTQWEIDLVWYPYREFPWVVDTMKPLEDQKMKSIEKLFQTALHLQKSNVHFSSTISGKTIFTNE